MDAEVDLPPHRALIWYLETALDCLGAAEAMDSYLPYEAQRLIRQMAEDLTDLLERLPLPHLRDQAVSVDMVFAEWKGRSVALWHVIERQGMTPYLDEELTQTAHALRRIQAQQWRLRALLKEAPQPRQEGRN